MLDEVCFNVWQCGICKLVFVLLLVYLEIYFFFFVNVYNYKVWVFYQCYGVQLIDVVYEVYEEKGDVLVMIIKYCLWFVFNFCLKQVKGFIKSWKVMLMQLIYGDEVLILKFDCCLCEMYVVGKIKNYIFKMLYLGSIVVFVSLDDLMKMLLKCKGV